MQNFSIKLGGGGKWTLDMYPLVVIFWDSRCHHSVIALRLSSDRYPSVIFLTAEVAEEVGLFPGMMGLLVTSTILKQKTVFLDIK